MRQSHWEEWDARAHMTPALRHFGDHIFSQPFLHLPFFGSSLVTILGSLSLHTNHIIQNNDWIDFQTLCKKSLFFYFFASEIKRGGDFKQHQRFSSNSGETGYSTRYTCHTCHREAWPISTADFVPTELARAVTEISFVFFTLTIQNHAYYVNTKIMEEFWSQRL